MLRGRLQMQTADGSETYTAGEAFYWAKREKTARLASPIAGRALRSRHCSRIAAERDPAADGARDIYEFGEPRR
jgi:hypothetical protein